MISSGISKQMTMSALSDKVGQVQAEKLSSAAAAVIGDIGGSWFFCPPRPKLKNGSSLSENSIKRDAGTADGQTADVLRSCDGGTQ